MNKKDFAQTDWDHYAACYDALNALRPYRALQQKAAEMLAIRSYERILDAGCGTGNFTKLLIDHAEKRKRARPDIYAVDYSKSMLARAKAKCAEEAAFLRLNLNRPLPFPDGYFHAVASINALYALTSPAATIREFKRVLVPGGRLVLVTPKAGYENGLILKVHCGSTKPDEYWKGMHASAEREELLIREACADEPDERIALQMLAVAQVNRVINKTAQFHFYTDDALTALWEKSGFSLMRKTLSYAEQCFVVVLKKV